MQDETNNYWEDRSDLLAGMIMVRSVEKHLLNMFSRGLLPGTVHTCLGQEACAIGVAAATDPDHDIIFSNHRGHGHYLGYCGDIDGLIAEVAGLPCGVCGGVGGSQHIRRNNFYTNGIQGAGVPIAAGMALAEKHKHSGVVSIVCLGDGTFGQGVVYEAMNIAALWQLPMIFMVENNGIAQTTPAGMQHAGDLAARAVPFGIPVTRIDGQDVDAVYEASRAVLSAVRDLAGPQMLFFDTCRFGPHSKGDDTRTAGEIAQLRTRDPIFLKAERDGRTDKIGHMEEEWGRKLSKIEAMLFEKV